MPIRCVRSSPAPGSAPPCRTTAREIVRPSASVVISTEIGLMPVVRSHCPAQADRSRPEESSSAESRSSKVALSKACAAKYARSPDMNGSRPT